MKKTLAIIVISLLILISLLAGSAYIMSQYVDPNKFKGRISQLVYAKTGQVLVINGNMQWSIFPWVGLKANNLTYYNTPSFTPQTFVSAKEMDIKIKLLPLVTGKIEIGNITLNNATLNLIKNKSGKFNWQTLIKEEKKATTSQNSEFSPTISNLSIASLKIKNGKLNWYDQQKNSNTSIDELNITSKKVQFGQPFPVSVQFDLLNDQKQKSLTLDLNSDITLSPDYKRYLFHDVKIKSELLNQENNIIVKATGDIAADFHKQTCLADFKFTVDDIQGQLNLKGSHLNNKPYMSGIISTDSFNLKKLLQDFGSPINTKESDALKSVSLLGKINIVNSNFALSELHAKIDDTDIYGQFNVLPNDKKIRFNLSANHINVNDYLLDKDSSSSTSAKSDLTNAEKRVSGKTKNNPWQVNGVLKVATLNVDKLKIANLNATLDVKNNIIKIAPLGATLYDGQLEGSVIIDKHQQDKTTIYLKQALKNLNIKNLIHEFSDSNKLSGTADLDADLTSVTNANTSFLAALNGKINLALKNGSLQGIDIIYQLSRAHALIKHLPSPAISDTKQTQFGSLVANAAVTNGVINTDDLALTSDYLKVTGKGTTNLVTKEIHYRLNALAQPRLAKENHDIGKEVTAYQVPIKVSGKLSKPSVNLDFAELAKIFYAKKIEKSITTHLENNVNRLKENLKEQVQDKLKDYSPAKLLNKLTKPQNKSEQAPPVVRLEDSMEENS